MKPSTKSPMKCTGGRGWRECVRQACQSRVAAWLLLVVVAGAASAYCVARFMGPAPLQTNLLALLPATQADPVEEKAVDRLANALGDRAVFLVTDAHGDDHADGDDDPRAMDAAQRLAALLTASGAFRSVTARLPPFDPAQIGRFYLPWQFGLLSAEDRADLRAHATPLSERFKRQLYAFAPMGLSVGLAQDPAGWLERWMADLPLATTNMELERGMLVAHHDGATSVLVSAALRGSAYDARVQRASVQAATRSEAALSAQFPRIDVAHTGAVFYAEAARSSAERETHTIGAVSVCGIALLMLWAFRSPRLMLFGFLSTALGIVCALAATLWAFGQLHLLTLVFGASLTGEAVDYSIQYFIACLDDEGDEGAGRGRAWQPRQSARKVRAALTVALTTSLLGYLMLACVPFGVLRQIACFAVVGIGVAFASVMWLLPALMPTGASFPGGRRRAKGRASSGASASPAPFVRRPQRLFALAGRTLRPWRWALAGRRGLAVCALLLLASVPGWRQLTGNDDVHLLVQPPPALVAGEQAIRRATGIASGAQFFVVKGHTAEDALARSEMLTDRLAMLHGAAQPDGWLALTSFVPSAQRQRENRALVAARVFDDPARVRAALSEAGFRDSVTDGWLAAWQRSGQMAGGESGQKSAQAVGQPAGQTVRQPAGQKTGEKSAGEKSRVLTVSAWLEQPWAQPFRYLWMGQVAGRQPGGQPNRANPQRAQNSPPEWAALVIPHRVTPANEPALRALAQQVPGASFVDKAASVSRLLGQYRTQSMVWLGGAALVVLALLMLRYGARAGVAVALPVLLAISVVMAFLGYAHRPLTLFHCLALVLVLGVGANYAVFLREGALRLGAWMGRRANRRTVSRSDAGAGAGPEPGRAGAALKPDAVRQTDFPAAFQTNPQTAFPSDARRAEAGSAPKPVAGAAFDPDARLGAVWAGVLLSAATTLLSFGMLGMSAMPALHDFGFTLALGIVVAVLFAPLGLSDLPQAARARSAGNARITQETRHDKGAAQ